MKNSPRKIELEDFRKVVDKVKAEGYPRVGLYSWTEPFLNRTLENYIEIVKEYDLPCEISTTLSLRRIQNMEACFRSGLDLMIVSISGMDQGVYQRNHVGGNIDYVFANLEKASSLIRENNLSTKIRLRFFKMEHNQHHIESARSYAEKLGVAFELLQDSTDPSTSEYHKYTNDYFVKQSISLPELIAPEEVGKVCPLMFDVVAIDDKSDIYLCDAMPYHPFFRIGNYLDLSEDQLLLKRYSHSFCRVCTYPRREATDSDAHRLVRAIEARTGRVSHTPLEQMGNRVLSIDAATDEGSEVRYLNIDHTPELSVELQSISDLDMLYVPHEPERYYKTGYDAFKLCQKAVGKWLPRRVVDFGVGYGRVSRWFRQEWPSAIVYGVDINTSSLSFVQRSLGVLPIQVDAHLSVRNIPGDIDLIFCGSLLTGLDEWQWDAVIRLVVPALGPSGILVITTHGRAMSQMLRDNINHFGELIDGASLLSTFEKEGFAYAPYAADHPTFGVSLSSPAWVMSKLQQIPELKIISFEEQGWGQDVVVLKRNPWPMAVVSGASEPVRAGYSANGKATSITAFGGLDDRIEISIAGTTVRVPAGVDRETLESVLVALTNSSDH